MKRKTIERKLTTITAEIIKIRDDNTCQHCGVHTVGRNCHVSHVKSKGKYGGLRWDLNNLKLLCYRCHIHWWHKEPTEVGDWFKSEYPKRWEYLKEKMNQTIKLKQHDLEEMLKDYEKTLKSLT